ncbi:hypothetical protein BKA93DRAFT_267011 [Sparassis latifolia]
MEGSSDRMSDATSVPIALLPEDILYEIFYVLTRSTFGTRLGCTYPVVTHVCRHWRHLALHSPQLWTFVCVTPSRSTTLIQEYLARSKDSPLYVQFISFGSALRSLPALELKGQVLSEHVHRIFEFRAVGFSRMEMKALLSSFTSPAPQLYSLHLQTDQRLFVEDLFGGQAPSIRDISMKRVATPWLPCRNMTRLDVDNQPAPALWELLLTLRNSPALQVLKLGMYGTVLPADVPEPQGPIIELLQLQTLALITHVHEDVALILSHLSFPPSTAVSLKLRGIRMSPLNLDRGCSSLCNMTSGVQDIILDLVSDNSWSTCVTLESMDSRIKTQWEWFDAEPDNLDLTHIGFAAMSFTAIRHISIRATSYRTTVAQWLGILNHISTVVSAHIDFVDSMVLLFFLALAGGPETDIHTPISVCPNLKHLIVSRLDDSRENILQSLTSVLDMRAARGARLASLDITMRSGKEFPSPLLSVLRACVDKITIHCRAGTLHYGSTKSPD